MRNNLNHTQAMVQKFASKTLLCIEWLNPLMTAGNWVPELATIAGIIPLGAEPAKHSPWIDWEKIIKFDPDILCIMPCGYTIDQTLAEIDSLVKCEIWNKLGAVQNKQVYVADGHQYFNRSGPRLPDSARILAEIAHPQLDSSFEGHGWINI